MGSKILIVDDEPNILFILRHLLTREGYDVVSASNGRECFEMVIKEKPDLVILDIMMPDTDGRKICRKIKEKFPDLPVSMCSILGTSYEVDKSFSSGADRHIKKPLNFDEVLETATTLLSRPPSFEEMAETGE